MKIVPRIKIIGIGGAGNNALTRMAKFKIPGVQLIAINTDNQDLKKTTADLKIRIGREVTRGLGTGMNPDLGKKAAEEQKQEIELALKDSEMIFLTAGFGGGTGSGATPVVANIAKELGILTIAVITKPFAFEGASRKNIALNGIKSLEGKVDSLLLVSNDKLVSLVEKDTPLTKAFSLADEILHQAVASIIDLILRPSLVTISFADVKSILKDAGKAFFGQGSSKGENRGQEASLKALSSPLLEISPEQASRILFNISAKNLKLAEIDIVANAITKNIQAETKVIFGAREDDKLKSGEMKVTLIATGFQRPSA
ncbi:cell division protein FtsZ [Candidatus Parcubacteria bacterium]|nr:cell division protein FtsZ [Patescibacteria group bacterium]MBU4467056.1 cell division protein FtsZ [Patescibacteria group bacterium]MCG2688537.1 cell division protein FtsZ [Candidatus Parcubacteria bacterium]